MLKNFNRSLITLSVISLSLFAFAGLAHAKTHVDSEERAAAMEAREEARAERTAAMEARKSEREGAKEERMEVREEKQTARCEAMRERAQSRIGQMEENREVHIANYNRLSEKLDDIVTKMSEEGFDTSDLESAIATLEDLVSDYANTYSDFVAGLDSHAGMDCEDYEGGKREALNGAKDHLQT